MTSTILPESEYKARRERAQQAFAQCDLSSVLIYGRRNWYCDHAIRYITGYDSPLQPSILLLPVDNRPSTLIIGDADDLERARTVSFAENVVFAEDIVLAAVKELGQSEPDRLGVAGAECMGFSALDVLPRNLVEAIHAACPRTELIDVGEKLNVVRATRSALEIDLLREASRIADVGAEAFFSTVRAGISERDVWCEIWYAMQRAGAEDLHISMCRGPGSFWPHPASDAVFRHGDIVSVELSPRVGGYFSQSNRMCFIGESDREWRDLGTLAKESLKLAVRAIKPGIPAKDVVAQVNAFVTKSPLATMDVGGVHRLGHGCGIALDEGPFLTSANAAPLQPNMTMALHPIIYLPYRHSLLMLGDYVRVTETGAEVLTKPQEEIPIL